MVVLVDIITYNKKLPHVVSWLLKYLTVGKWSPRSDLDQLFQRTILSTCVGTIYYNE